MSHWGVTEVTRDEWLSIIEDWHGIARSLEVAATSHDFAEPRVLFSYDSEDFSQNFEVSKASLLRLFDELIAWLRHALADHTSISILGI